MQLSMPQLDRSRRGITLTEVLISVFVLGAGLLGLASLVPLGQYHAIQANHQDRAASCARWVFRQIDSQGVMNPSLWVTRTGVSPGVPRVFILDPRFLSVGLNQGDPLAGQFPYVVGSAGANWNLSRLTLNDPQMANTPMNFGVAYQLCTWRDDILFTAPNDNIRPGMQLDPSNQRVVTDGDYSWLAMVRPAEGENVPQIGSMPDRTNGVPRTNFIVSVVVLYNRAATVDVTEDVPSERQVLANPRGPGWFELVNDVAPNGPIGRLAPNQWVLMSAEQVDPNNESPSPPLWFHRWYKIVNVVETPSGNRAVKVSGPDWPTAMVDNATVRCTIIDGAVGVYERRMNYNPYSYRTPLSN